MASELLTAAVGLLGAAFGAAGAVWAGSVTARSQRRQTQDQLEAAQRRWNLDSKREIYMQLLRCGSLWQSTTWELFHALRTGAGTEERSGVYQQKVQRWQDFAATSTTAKVFTADIGVQRAADSARDALLAAERVCDDWHFGRGGDEHERRVDAFRAAGRDCETAVAALAAQIEIALSR
ncbi:hypothetical protein ACFWC5_09930 [Streptomyces sp. NPDC060085]|uniref:hypothetical protein n=1 Tax=Streptomyces sp. NPDC060085 TaxID=3347054 RepID=UPI003660FC55